MEQEPDKRFEVFLSDLWHPIKSCNYSNIEETTIRDRIMLGIRESMTTPRGRSFYRQGSWTCRKQIDISRSAEATTRQLKATTSPDEMQALSQQPCEQLQWSKSQPRHEQLQAHSNQRSLSTDRWQTADRCCQYCSRKHAPSKKSCPVYG